MADRKTYIGSSDARYILNGDWERLYRQKVGLEPETEPSFAMRLGQAVEDFHLDETITALNAEKGGGFKFSKTTPQGDQHFATYRHDIGFNTPLLGSHPDALLRDMGGIVYPLEVKITGRWRNADEAADWYMPQLQHHMLCWGVDVMLFSVICGTNEPERMWIGSSPEWQSHYLDRCDSFWGHVAKEIPPPPAFYDTAKKPKVVPDRIADTVPRNGWKKRSLDGDNRAPALIDEFLETREAVKRHESAKKELKGLMREDENELYGERLTLKRDARGAIRITVNDKEKAA